MTERTHFVYQAYDADGLLLYVGCTGNPGARYKAHMAGNGDARGWFDPFVVSWRVRGPYTKPVAFALERELINDLQPIWNGHSVVNRQEDRRLIHDYLAFRGVRYVDNPWRPQKPNLINVRTGRLEVAS